MIHSHVPWTRVVADVPTAYYGEHIECWRLCAKSGISWS